MVLRVLKIASQLVIRSMCIELFKMRVVGCRVLNLFQHLKYPLSIIAFLLVFSCKIKEKESSLPYYNTPDFTPFWTEKADKPHRIADFSFQNQDGKTVTNADFDGKIYIANFFFTTCPSICPKMQSNLTAVATAFEHDDNVHIISHTVMPWIDTVGRLKEYADLKNIDSKKWQLVTGSEGVIYDLARKSYFAEEAIGYTKDSTQFLHTEHFLLVDGNRRLRGLYNGTLPLEVQRLIEDIKTLKKEK